MQITPHTQQTAHNIFNAQDQANSAPILRMVKNERMGGMVPAWEKPSNPARIDESFAQRLHTAQTPDSALAYQGTAHKSANEQPFGFGDILDMINPLQHIPVVSHFYREFTGDTIRSASKIIGGALYGGPLGAAGSLVNAVIEKETGKDTTGNAIALVMNGQRPKFASLQQPSAAKDNTAAALPETVNWAGERITTHAKNLQAQEDIAAQLLAFTDLKSDETIQIFKLKKDEMQQSA